jgi:hypothetical protein
MTFVAKIQIYISLKKQFSVKVWDTPEKLQLELNELQ